MQRKRRAQAQGGSGVALFLFATNMNRDELHAVLSQRFQAIEQRIRDACARAGRKREEVTLVAVTKMITPAIAMVLPDLGITDLGESRPQDLWLKAEALPKSVRWHLVGHLQRNKIERTLPVVHMVHSVDSVRLLDAMEKEASRWTRKIAVLLEVNASREPNKLGFVPEQVAGLAPRLNALQHLRIEGLMTMAALEGDPQNCRPTFVLLRKLRDQLRGKLDQKHALGHLSMGMTNDFEVAVEEGATLVRIGRAIFGTRPTVG
jgi:PLP dependent protein